MTVIDKFSLTRPSRAIFLAAAGVSLLGLLAANLSNSNAVRSRESSAATPSVGESGVQAPTTMKIVPAEVLDGTDQRFVGTGDGNAGAWATLR